MTRGIREADVENTALHWLRGLGWQVKYGPDLACGMPQAERGDPGYRDVILEGRLRDALARLNPELPAEALADALRKLLRLDAPSLIERNHAMHRLLVDGVTVEYRGADGGIRGAQARVIDFDAAANNDFLAVNQFTVVEQRIERRADVVLFVNGLPLVVIELKNPTDAQATLDHAFRQLQTYQKQIPALFTSNAALVIATGLQARLGALGAGREWFKPWRTITGEADAPATQTELEVLLAGVCSRQRLLQLLRHFIVFESGDGLPIKKLAGYHQFHAVNVAIEETLRAARLQVADARGRYSAGAQPGGDPGDRRIGVVWHTQGSGKSLTMAFYAGRVILHPALQNPTVVLLTDRNDLDQQLFGTFARCRDLLRQPPVQAESRARLRELLDVAAGGVVFTTLQKFLPDSRGEAHPVLSARRNIVVIADEAHRSQYDFIDGFARHLRDALPNASFIGFTGTPIERADASTRAVFGDTISIYDIERAVTDCATVPIYYESRLARLALKDSERPRIDAGFEEVTEGEEAERKEQLRSRWAQLEAVVGAESRVQLIARDLVTHFEQRREVFPEGKAMLVCMSRRIAVEMYQAITALRPGWASDDDAQGEIKVVMTGSASDPLDWQSHIRNKPRREDLAERFRDPADPFKLVIVRDMWLTGFDCPSLTTLYIDKPMRGHGLMQAIARVNRVFKDKPGGLVVDYLGLADELKQALATYTEAGGSGRTAIDQSEAVALVREKVEVCRGLFHGFDYRRWLDPAAGGHERLALLPFALEHILALAEGKPRLLRAVADLTKAFALAVPHPDALALRDEVGFFQAVRTALANREPDAGRRSEADLDHAIRQIVSQAVATDQIVDIFAAAGLKKPDLSILSDDFLAEVRDMPQRNLAVELLQKLLKGEIRQRAKRNVVQGRSFTEMLEQTLRRYHNRAIETAKVIEELIQIAKDVRAAGQRGEQLGLSEDEVAFYDALETNDSAVKVLGDDNLRLIARELVKTLRANVTIDWTRRETVRANLRVLVKRILRQYGYPPDKQEKATQTVLEQAEQLTGLWAGAAG
ncbi:MAG: type I restriction endonuclease subunit R [Metallibacterium scheffleri]|jgi:type I restriction enzyme R subunit|uniref:type I restriction endonuclease subunit R n=1 Tax=Metallibacterium scheffleri TaxID=993689 RepID=UPI0026F330FF|nr:type I restriction endonuclease subunit R [Metallibacterium scheffleri]MCK9366000.1 type I restriction endonuclease subunit R [Metallibacterium scheffleri]